MKARQGRFALFDLVAVLAACVVSGVWYSGSASLSATQPALQLANTGYLTVGTYGTVIPGIAVGPGDKLGGVNGILLTAFAKNHGLRLKLYQTTFASMILAVEQKKIDVGTYNLLYQGAGAARLLHLPVPGQPRRRLYAEVVFA